MKVPGFGPEEDPPGFRPVWTLLPEGIALPISYKLSVTEAKV